MVSLFLLPVFIVFIIIVFVVYSFLYELFRAFTPKVKIFTIKYFKRFVFKIKESERLKSNLYCCTEFARNLGPSVSAVSIVALVIPMDSVSGFALTLTFCLGIIITKIGKYTRDLLDSL